MAKLVETPIGSLSSPSCQITFTEEEVWDIDKHYLEFLEPVKEANSFAF